MSRLYIRFVPPPIPFAYVLDNWPTGALYAFSMRLLREAYVGPCLRVRRTSDNTEQDINFVNNYIDISALSAFVGAGSGYVVRWYDQTGNGYHKTQSTALDQPPIVLSGVVVKVGTFVVMGNNGSDFGLANSYSTAGTLCIAFNIFEVDGECLPATVAGGFYGVMQNANSSPPDSNMGTPLYYKNKTAIISPTRDDLYDQFNTIFSLLTTRNINLSPYTSISSKYPSYRGILGKNCEEIVYANQTEPRGDIEDNIIAYYGL